MVTVEMRSLILRGMFLIVLLDTDKNSKTPEFACYFFDKITSFFSRFRNRRLRELRQERCGAGNTIAQ